MALLLKSDHYTFTSISGLFSLRALTLAEVRDIVSGHWSFLQYIRSHSPVQRNVSCWTNPVVANRLRSMEIRKT
jgi:hypothetical protein